MRAKGKGRLVGELNGRAAEARNWNGGSWRGGELKGRGAGRKGSCRGPEG